MIMNYTKRISAFLCAFLLIVCSGICVSAESKSKLIDDAGLFTSSEQTEIEARLEEVSDKTGWDVIVYTNFNGVKSDETEDYYNRYYDNHDFGKGSDRSGVMFTIDMGSEKRQITTKGEAMYYFGNDRLSRLKNDIVSNINSREYKEAVLVFVEYTEEFFDSGKADDADLDNIKLAEKEANPLLYALKHYGIIAGAIALVVATITVVSVGHRYKHNGKQGTYDLKSNSVTNLTASNDIFLNKTVTVTVDRDDDDRDSSSSSSSSSSSHGGGGSF